MRRQVRQLLNVEAEMVRLATELGRRSDADEMRDLGEEWRSYYAMLYLPPISPVEE